MITQEFINGYIQALNTMKMVYDGEINALFKELDSSSIDIQDFILKTMIIHKHIEYIDATKESYRNMIQRLNNSPKK